MVSVFIWLRRGPRNYRTSHGLLEIDTNKTENEIRDSAVGKKNWLFFGSPQSGWKAALLYTLTRNCARLGIDPNAYFRDVLERLPTMTNHQVESLLPDNWPKERPATASAA